MSRFNKFLRVLENCAAFGYPRSPIIAPVPSVPRIVLPAMPSEEWDEQRAMSGCAEMFPADEWETYLAQRKENPMTISESIMKAAHAEIEAQPAVSDIEKAARAIVVSMGGDPDALGYLGAPYQFGRVSMPPRHMAPLWTFFTHEAEAALNAVHK